MVLAFSFFFYRPTFFYSPLSLFQHEFNPNNAYSLYDCHKHCHYHTRYGTRFYRQVTASLTIRPHDP